MPLRSKLRAAEMAAKLGHMTKSPESGRVTAASRSSREDREIIFEAIANYTYDWETWMDSEGKPLWINPAVARMTGFSVADCMAMTDYPLGLVHEEDREMIAGHMQAAAGGSSGNDVEFRILDRDGRIIWAAVSWQSLIDSTGRALGFRTSVRDITLRKLAEVQLKAAHDEAARANRAKSKFLAAASHDLRQPLQAASLFLAALRGRIEDLERLEIADSIRACLDAGNELLDALLEVSQLDAGVLKAERQTLALGDLFERCETEFLGAAMARGVDLRIVASSCFVESDPILLWRILQNFLSNAIRYTDSGRILVGARRCGGQVRIEVWDTGAGIPEDKQAAIFQEFYQLANPERDRTRGLGLGLAIVERIARLLYHPVAVKSKPGRGSVFSVTVPISGSARQPDSLVSPGSAAVIGSRILAIDDEPMQLRALALFLEDLGCETICAATADEALAAIDGKPDKCVDLIIADYRLRDHASGIALAEAIRARFNPAPPCLLLTGDTEPARLAEAEASGFTLVHKPVQPDELVAKICKALE